MRLSLVWLSVYLSHANEGTGHGRETQLSLKGFAGDTAMEHAKTSMIAGEGMQSLRRSHISGLLFCLSQLALFASEALILWYGAHLVSEWAVFSIVDGSTRIDPDDPEAEPVNSIHGEIELRHVDFAYPSRPDVIVFKDLNLRIRAGQSQALVGASGSGKSSVIALIKRFYDPTAGKPALFAASIFDHIAYGKGAATEAEWVREGFSSPGGQKQRIAIARAVLKDSRILLLDEATSTVDAESECVLQEAVERLMRNRTTVLVAHRLSTIRNVDNIGVVQDSRIMEQGCHSELIAIPEGAYSKLLLLQHHNI
ncbi:ABC transporter B family member 19 [Hibiscus syriacus]|uniref:ABC transporter B family member 19 n=1 Tax=Hibiscus syriacus TaxID=106335 RepID=A0A6A3AZ80_HIBSY|nr:ABC transporter B family member 19 [Hibiscus syriacus]